MKKTTQPSTETFNKFFADKEQVDKLKFKEGKKKTIMTEEEFDAIFSNF